MDGNGKQPDSTENSGGSGDVYSEGLKRDRLERRAIVQRWPIADRYREPIINRAIKKLLDPNTSDRDFNQTLNAILKAEGQNQTDDHKLTPDEVNVNHKVLAYVPENNRELERISGNGQH